MAVDVPLLSNFISLSECTGLDILISAESRWAVWKRLLCFFPALPSTCMHETERSSRKDSEQTFTDIHRYTSWYDLFTGNMAQLLWSYFVSSVFPEAFFATPVSKHSIKILDSTDAKFNLAAATKRRCIVKQHPAFYYPQPLHKGF